MVESILSFLSAGIVFGLSGGIAPGPTMTIVIAQAIRYNWKEGAKVAIAPLITDGPIILVGVFLLSLFHEFEAFLGTVSLIGTCFLVYLAYESFTVRRVPINLQEVKPRSVLKGVAANALNPSPYIFWFSIGCPMILKAYDSGILIIAVFITSFFFGLVGTKVIIALTVAPFWRFRETRSYLYLMRFLGVLLLIYALLFFRDSLKAFGLL